MARKKGIDDAIKKAKKSRTDQAIEERLAGCARSEASHIIYVGELVERVLCGEFGAVIKALTAGRISTELSTRDGSVSSDRRIGRLEMANDLWTDLEQFVLDKDKVQAELLQSGELTTQTFNYHPS